MILNPKKVGFLDAFNGNGPKKIFSYLKPIIFLADNSPTENTYLKNIQLWIECLITIYNIYLSDCN